MFLGYPMCNLARDSLYGFVYGELPALLRRIFHTSDVPCGTYVPSVASVAPHKICSVLFYRRLALRVLAAYALHADA